MNYDDGAFDAVVDKGTFDSILCGDGSGPNADQMLSDPPRALTPGRLHLHQLRCERHPPEVLPEGRLLLDRVSPYGGKAHYLRLPSCAMRTKRNVSSTGSTSCAKC